MPILTTSFLKILFLLIFGTTAIFIANEYFYDFGLGISLQLLSLGLIFSALCLGTSPAISVAVISEMNIKNRMSQMILGSAIIKDVLVIIFLAFTLAFASSLVQGQNDIMGSFSHLIKELGLSLLAGTILGLILIFYIRIIQQEMFLFIVAMILVTAKISDAIHLELLLVFILAGIILRNFSKQEKVLHETLEKVSLPVFVIFFTNIGAGLDLKTTLMFLPVAGILFAARSLSFIAASKIAGHKYDESPSIRNRIWLGYLPQAGVTLGLVSIVSQDLPVYSEIIKNIGFGLVTVNLLVGPIFLRMLLQEKESSSLKEKDETSELSPSSKELLQKITNGEFQSDKDHSFNLLLVSLSEKLEDPKLKRHFIDVSMKFYKTFRKEQIAPQQELIRGFIKKLREIGQSSEEEIISNIDEYLQEMGEKGHGFYNCIKILQQELNHIPIAVDSTIPLSAIRIQKEDRLWIKISKIMKSPYYWLNKESKRDVSLRKIAKFNMDPLIGRVCVQMIYSWYHLLGKHIDNIQYSLENKTFLSDEFLNQLENENDIWLKTIHSDFRRDFERVSKQWILQLNRVNTVYLSDSMIRYSTVEPEIKENFEKAKKHSILWEEKFIYYRNRLKVIVQSALLSNELEKLINEKIFHSIKEAQTNIDELVDDIFSFFENIKTKIKNDPEGKDQTIYQDIRKKTWVFAEQHMMTDIKTKTVRKNFRLFNRDISMTLKRILHGEVTNFQIASDKTPIHKIKSPGDILVKKINLHEIFEQNIMINFLPFIEEKVEGVSNYLDSIIMEMEQLFSVINCFLEAEDNEKQRSKSVENSILKTMDAERERILELHEGFGNYILQVNSSVKRLLKDCQKEVGRGTEHFSITTAGRSHLHQKFRKLIHLLEDKKQQITNSFDKFYKKLKDLAFQNNQREIDKLISKKVLSKTLDTKTIRQFIRETYTISFQLNQSPHLHQLPRVYFRLFNLDPVQDKRFFIAYQDHWNYLKTLSNEENSDESQKILILGDRGMGKSSLINVSQMDIKTGTLIRIDSEDNITPIKTLARTLNCNTDKVSLLQALKKTNATIIMDNADQMVNKKCLEDFEKLFELICHSPKETHWILSITKCNMENLDKAYGIQSLFSKIIDLNRLDFKSGKDIVFSRHRLSGLKIYYPKTFLSSWILKLGLSVEDEMFFRVLFERSKGSIRHLIYLWLMSLESASPNSIKLSIERTTPWGMPVFETFTTLQKYILGQFYSYHSMGIESLGNNLGTTPSTIINELRYMEECGLVKRLGPDRTVFKIPNHLVTPVGEELKKEGILYEEIY